MPGSSVEILPKIGNEGNEAVRRALVHMLAVAWGIPIADSEAALLTTQRKNLLEILVRLFADSLASLIYGVNSLVTRSALIDWRAASTNFR